MINAKNVSVKVRICLFTPKIVFSSQLPDNRSKFQNENMQQLIIIFSSGALFTPTNMLPHNRIILHNLILSRNWSSGLYLRRKNRSRFQTDHRMESCTTNNSQQTLSSKKRFFPIVSYHRKDLLEFARFIILARLNPTVCIRWIPQGIRHYQSSVPIDLAVPMCVPKGPHTYCRI